MQFTTLAALLSLAAFGAAQSTAICNHGKYPFEVMEDILSNSRIGQYSCGTSGGKNAIYQCNGGQQRLVSICAYRCEFINGSPFCT
jgi:hypothetical protein